MRLAPLAALLLLAPLAAAQTLPAQPAVSVALDATSLPTHAGNQTTVNATITNGGNVDATVSLALTVPAGWDFLVDMRTFPLPAGGSQTVHVIVTAPGTNAGDEKGDLHLVATLTDAASGPGPAARTAVATATVAVSRIDPPSPPAPPGYTPEGVAVVVIGSLALIAGVVVLETRRRRTAARADAAQKAAALAVWTDRETGILIAADGPPMPWGLRRELMQRVVVRNTHARPRVAHLGVERAPPGWTVALSLPRLPLEAGEVVGLTVYLNPDARIPGGEKAQIVLTARPAEAQEAAERLVLDLEAPHVRIPTTVPVQGADPVRPTFHR